MNNFSSKEIDFFINTLLDKINKNSILHKNFSDNIKFSISKSTHLRDRILDRINNYDDLKIFSSAIQKLIKNNICELIYLKNLSFDESPKEIVVIYKNLFIFINILNRSRNFCIRTIIKNKINLNKKYVINIS